MNNGRSTSIHGRRIRLGAAGLSLLALLLAVTGLSAGEIESGHLRGLQQGSGYTVTITNLTYDQIISPPVVVVHDGRFRLFEPGQPADSELAALAEDGMSPSSRSARSPS